MSIYSKGKLLSFLPLIMAANQYLSPEHRSDKCVCKKCGKSFIPISNNKKVFCSVECFKNRNQGGVK